MDFATGLKQCSTKKLNQRFENFATHVHNEAVTSLHVELEGTFAAADPAINTPFRSDISY